MAQPERIEVNSEQESLEPLVMPGKRKREAGDEEDAVMAGVEEIKPSAMEQDGWRSRDQKALVGSFVEVLKSLDTEDSLLARPVIESTSDDHPQAKRQRSADPAGQSIADKAAANTYSHLEDLVDDLRAVIKTTLSEIEDRIATAEDTKVYNESASRVRDFRDKALDLFYREKAYPQLPNPRSRAEEADTNRGKAVLSLIGFAPAEKRLFSSLPAEEDVDVQSHSLPPGVAFTHVEASSPKVKTQTLGDLFAAPRALPILQPPKPPKSQAKGNTLDWYYPELEDASSYRANSYFSQKLTAGQFLDYTNATPASQSKSRHRERAQSLADRKPSTSELEAMEMETLFRGAFSSFAPTKDDSAALVPSSTVGRVWWQRSGQWRFQQMIEAEYYDAEPESKAPELEAVEVDEAAIQKSIDTWDDSIVDPSLEDVMGTKADDRDKEVDEILDEVSGLIETLASYQRIRNLNLPNSQNRQNGDPVNGDMLANEGPQPSEEEQATYQVLKAQLTLIIKTLPPYAVAKLNGDQLEELLISTKMQVAGEQYMGFMEEDEAGMQARARAQQQASQNVRPPSRTPSNAGMSYGKAYQPNQYGTPTRTPSQGPPQPYYRQGSYGGSGGYQQPQTMPPAAQQHRPSPHPNQYQYQQRTPSGVPNQYATQLAKTQTPYGHQNVSNYGAQPRMQYGAQQQPPPPHQQPGTPTQRPYPSQGYPPHNGPPTPSQTSYGNYTNGAAAVPPRTQSPQMTRQPYSPNMNMQQQQQGQRYNAPNPSMQSGMNRFSAGPPPSQASPPPPAQQHQQGQHGTPTSYHTVIPEASQQRIIEQARARVAAQERATQFGEGPASGSNSPGGSGAAGMDANRLHAARTGLATLQQQQQAQSPHTASGAALERSASPHVPPRRVTPVPLPNMLGAQRKGSD